jgi:hypothetical protein
VWLITVHGFYSVVLKPGENRLSVRARVGADLDRLRERYMPTLTETLETPQGDYRYRAWVSHDDFAEGVARIAGDVTYDNFKDTVMRTDHERAHVYLEVWEALRALQPTAAYAADEGLIRPSPTLTGEALDAAVATAVAESAASIAPRTNTTSFLEMLVEEAFADSLRNRLPGLQVTARRRHHVPDWEPQPRELDIAVLDAQGVLVAAAELKVDDVEWTLWDLYKMVSITTRPDVRRAYLVVAATERKWRGDRDCVALFEPAVGEQRIYSSADLFEQYAAAWLDLLGGGPARPKRVPDEIAITAIGRAHVTSFPNHELRAIAVEAVPESGWLVFHGDWPEGVAAIEHRPVAFVDCGGYPVPVHFKGRQAAPWLAEHVPKMTEMQFRLFLDELRRRGWTDSEFENRVRPLRPPPWHEPGIGAPGFEPGTSSPPD